MKKVISLALALALVFALAACGSAVTLPADVEIPNPWQEVDTTADAETILGFAITAPETLAGLSQSAVRVLKNGDAALLECYYGGGETGADYASLRKAPASTEDISGDYTVYAKTETVTLGDIAVTEKGDGENVFSAVWTKGEYSYAFFSTVGVSADAFAELISGIE